MTPPDLVPASDTVPPADWDAVKQGAEQAAADVVPPVVAQLQALAAEAQRLPLWPPWHALPAVVSLVARMAHAAAEPPRPDPADLDSTASAWTAIAQRVEQSIGDVTGTSHRTGDDIWQGAAGDAYRSSLDGLGRHLDTVATAARAVAKDLTDTSTAMAAARERHERGRERLHRHLTVSWDDLLPWEAQDHLQGVVHEVVEAVDEICASHRDAHTAITGAAAHIAAHVDTISLPATLAGGVSAYDQVNASAGGSASIGSHDTGPLRGTAAARADAALSRMSPGDRAHARMLLQRANGADRKGWVLAAIGSGLNGPGLDAYVRHLATLDAAQIAALDPTTQAGVYVQPDDTTCGSSSLVMARMLNHPDYAMYVATGVDPTGAHPVSDASAAARFHAEALAMHHHTNEHWPQQLGTFPTSATDEMSRTAGVHGTTYRTELVDPNDLDTAYSHATAAVDSGHAVPIYAYGMDEPTGQAGAHVTLAVGTRGDDLTVYNPADGSFAPLTRRQFTGLDNDRALGWPRPLSMSLPEQSVATRAASRLG